MAFTDKAEFRIARHIVQPGGVNIETITADKDLTYKDSQYQVLTNSKGSVAVVKLPKKKQGAYFWITCASSSAHTINVKDFDGVDVIATPNLGAGKAALIACNGSEWAVVLEQT
jgi:hypothetical protein